MVWLHHSLGIKETVKEFVRRYFGYRDDFVGVGAGVVCSAICYYLCSFCEGFQFLKAIE